MPRPTPAHPGTAPPKTDEDPTPAPGPAGPGPGRLPIAHGGAERPPALRRVPAADRRNPWHPPERVHGAPPLHEVRASREGATRIHWEERAVVSPTPELCRMRMPITGAKVPADFSSRLSSQLHQLWVRQPTPVGPQITSVTACIDENRGHPALTIMLSLEPDSTDPRPLPEEMLRTDLAAAVAYATAGNW